ncbi:MAG: hypothetical protein IJ306_07900 [Oscillospiraceae bacterium]|nr:hypothetical protein [Oscillospiraceae bacterium]
MAEQRYLYIVFLSTPYRTGSFIRAVTRFPYNHMGISLSPKFRYFYSFSRHYKAAPFYGGFTKESILRYRYNGKTATMKICAVPVSEENYQEAKKRLEFLESHSEAFVYNMLSAMCFPFRINVRVDRSYTCAEFVLSMLRKYSDIPVLKECKFCSIKEACEILEPYKIFEGSAGAYLKNADWFGDTFPEEMGTWFYTKKTFYNNGRLAYRFVKGKLNKKRGTSL